MFDIYCKKLKFYRCWYLAMTKEEKAGFIGKWVYENCQIYTGIIKEMDSVLPSFNKRSQIGNYSESI